MSRYTFVEFWQHLHPVMSFQFSFLVSDVRFRYIENTTVQYILHQKFYVNSLFVILYSHYTCIFKKKNVLKFNSCATFLLIKQPHVTPIPPATYFSYLFTYFAIYNLYTAQLSLVHI